MIIGGRRIAPGEAPPAAIGVGPPPAQLAPPGGGRPRRTQAPAPAPRGGASIRTPAAARGFLHPRRSVDPRRRIGRQRSRRRGAPGERCESGGRGRGPGGVLRRCRVFRWGAAGLHGARGSRERAPGREAARGDQRDAFRSPADSARGLRRRSRGRGRARPRGRARHPRARGRGLGGGRGGRPHP